MILHCTSLVKALRAYSVGNCLAVRTRLYSRESETRECGSFQNIMKKRVSLDENLAPTIDIVHELQLYTTSHLLQHLIVGDYLSAALFAR